PVGLVVPHRRPRRAVRHGRRRRDVERAGRPGGPARVSEAALARRRPLAVPAQLPLQDRRHPGQHDPGLVPGGRRRPHRSGLRPALRRRPHPDARRAGGARRRRLPRLAGARRDRQPAAVRRRRRQRRRRLGLGDRPLMTDTTDPADDPIPPAPTGFVRRHVFSTDHKVIGRQFLFLGLTFLAVGGIMAMLIRWQLARPGAPVPLVGKLFFRSAGGVISPPANMASFWTLALATALLCASFFVPLGPPQAGWTAYATLSTALGTPGAGQTLWVIAIYLNGASSVMGAVNYITTVLRLRAPGMTWLRLPLTVWGLFLTSILNALFVPVLGAAMVLLLFDRLCGTQFFVAGTTPGAGGDPILYQHLFWLFGHPEVYILILPAWGIVGDLLAFFARKPAFGYRVTVGALCGVVLLSTVVYGHHMFTTG